MMQTGDKVRFNAGIVETLKDSTWWWRNEAVACYENKVIGTVKGVYKDSAKVFFPDLGVYWYDQATLDQIITSSHLDRYQELAMDDYSTGAVVALLEVIEKHPKLGQTMNALTDPEFDLLFDNLQSVFNENTGYS